MRRACPLLEAGLTGGLGAQIRHRDKRPDNEHFQEAARDARAAWPASAEHHTAIRFRTMKRSRIRRARSMSLP
jgi:hypothetical protein